MRVESEPLEERRGGAEQDGLAGPGVAADLVDVAAGLQRPDHAVGVDAADRRDLRPRDRLLVGDDRQRLERRAGQPGPLIVEEEPLDVRREVGGGLVAVAAGDPGQFEAALLAAGTRRPARRTSARSTTVGCSSSWASSSGGTGSWATSTIDSIARLNSAKSPTSSDMSAVVGVDEDHLAVDVGVGAPLDLDVTEPLGLVELDHALLEQLQHGEEADDHLDAVDEIAGEPPERDAPDPRQLVDQFGDRVGDRRGDRGDVEQVDRRDRARA